MDQSDLNLKRVGGNARANNDTILEYAIRDASYIYEQLLLYKLDIIICCGRGIGKNADLLYEKVLASTSPWEKHIDGFNYFYMHFENKINRTPMVSFYHPRRRANHDTYKSWYDSIKKISSLLLTK